MTAEMGHSFRQLVRTPMKTGVEDKAGGARPAAAVAPTKRRPSLSQGRRVRYIHWHAGEALERAERLRAFGYEVDPAPFDGPAALKAMRLAPPDTVVIDLSRVTSHGREVGVALRAAKPTRLVPLVFVGGEPDKLARVKQVLPDATFCSWTNFASALKRALARPPREVAVPSSIMASYAGVPLARKLGVKPDMTVRLVDAPDGFEDRLTDLPAGTRLIRSTVAPAGLTLWFVKCVAAYAKGLRAATIWAEHGGLWVVWPKQTSPLAEDLTQDNVRRLGLEAGLVDYKICAVDADWSGLRFAPRKTPETARAK